MKQLLFAVITLCAIQGSAQIQKNNKSALTIEKIMQDPDKWIGTSPENIFWDEQGKLIYFGWNPKRDTLSSLYSFNLKTRETVQVSVEEKQKLPGRFTNYNASKTKSVFI